MKEIGRVRHRRINIEEATGIYWTEEKGWNMAFYFRRGRI